MLNKFFILVILIGLSSLSAQTITPKISNPNFNNYLQANNVNDVKILAVMVDFQPDNFELTYGDGTFGSIYSEDYGNNIIDPLPHDKSYFEDHLQFAKNYYSKVSNNKVNVNYTVLPNIITVSKPMREYSPVGDESFKPLSDFSKEVWELVDTNYPNYDFSSFNTFLIFHAGAGKDISTSDLFGEARDLPSIYLGAKSFKNIYGETFNGFQLSDGSIVNNTMILPETESREESGFGGVSLIELSINGLIVSSIASHIGLPDLFDSETGKSAIGRFGLMDGQSLFAFAGLFPPEPSAWEKVYLGWEDPKIINTDVSNIIVTVGEIANETDNQIIKVPINSTEYYLIENRSRDANKDGVIITYKVGGQVRTINFAEDLDNFNNAFVDTMKGVVLDVDEHDWAVPGSGILIWHIDEKIASVENISNNRVNVGESRGVDLEEADGIQDIGEEFQTIFGETVIAEGEKFDLWYSGNTSKLYTNKFGLDSKPNTKTNSGANSLITFSNFSEISNQMSFDLSFGSSDIKIVKQTKLDDNLIAKNYKIIGGDLVHGYFSSDNNLYHSEDSTKLFNDFAINNYSLVKNGTEEIIFGAFENKLNILFYNDSLSSHSFDISSNISAPLVIGQQSGNDIEIILGLENGKVEKYIFNVVSKKISEQPISILDLFDTSVKQVVLDDNEIVAISETQYNDMGSAFDFPAPLKRLLLTKNIENKSLAIFLSSDNSIYTYARGDAEYKKIYSANSNIYSLALADIKNDGENYIVFTEGNNIIAINLAGSFAEKFPYSISDDNNFSGYPLIADINNDNYGDIIASTQNGNIYAVSGINGKLLNGFPLSVGGEFSFNQAIEKREDNLLLSVITNKNDFYFWSINSLGEVLWGSEYGNNMNTSSSQAAKSNNYISTYFPKNKTYNWPNPVYDNQTFIRTYVSEDSQVKVKVFDLAGDLVDEFEFSANGGYDSEYAWNVTEIQSGAYFAHVEVKSNSGKSESKIIKIAVVK